MVARMSEAKSGVLSRTLLPHVAWLMRLVAIVDDPKEDSWRLCLATESVLISIVCPGNE